MGDEKLAHTSNFFGKAWDPVFSQNRDCNDKSWASRKRRMEADGDDIGIFLWDFKDTIPSSRAQEVEDYCKGIHLSDLEAGAGTAGQRRDAWLSDMAYPHTHRDKSENKRTYQNPLSATGLHRCLKEPRFNSSTEPNADRRLIYIQNLDSAYILALAETASYQQVSTLRDAIWKHLALQTSIGVRIPFRGYLTFQLEFHLPYFALRKTPVNETCPPESVRNGPPRKHIDLSFLKIPNEKPTDQNTFKIHEATISLAICGFDNKRWVAYAFVDTDNVSDDESLSDKVWNVGEWGLDPIASDESLEVNANVPIWDPREYFLMILEIRIRQVLKEWQYLVRTVERAIKTYRERHPCILSDGHTGGKVKDVKKSFDWTQQAIDLLSRLLAVLSKTVKTWATFKSPDGDLGYFSDIPPSPDTQQRHLPFRAIQSTFERLEDLQEELLELSKSCKNSARTLQLRLTIEGNEAAQHNGLTQELMASIISPCMLATAYFTMPEAAMPFKIGSRSFVGCIIIIMILVRLIFFILSALPTWQWWWNKVKAWAKTVHLDTTTQRLVPNDFYTRFMLRRDSDNNDTTAEELHIIV